MAAMDGSALLQGAASMHVRGPWSLQLACEFDIFKVKSREEALISKVRI